MYNPPSNIQELIVLIREEASLLGEHYLVFILEGLNNPNFYSLKKECLELVNHNSIRNLLKEYEENHLNKSN